MADPTITKIDLNVPIQPIKSGPGTEIIIRGSFTSRHDGSVIDAATTTWPKETPGGASVDAIGLIDWERGGLHVQSRDPITHEIHALVLDQPGEACAAAGTTHCLVLNGQPAVKRLLGQQEWVKSLVGTMAVQEPPAIAPPIVPEPAVPYLGIAGAVLFAGIAGFSVLRWKKNKENSPEGRLLALSRRVITQLERADSVVAAPLKPTVDAAVKAIREKRFDAASNAGKRVADALRRINERLEMTAQEQRAAKEQEAADELLREMESALEAAEEMKRSHP